MSKSTAIVPYNHVKQFWLTHMHSRVGILMCDHMVCMDGFVMSVQASYYHYCEPRVNLYSGDYSRWEVMPFGHDDILSTWSDNEVAAFVPTDIINQVIENHGGLADNSIDIRGVFFNG